VNREIRFIVEKDPDGGFTAHGVGDSIFTEADTLDELLVNIREAVDCHFDEGQAPRQIRFGYAVRES
jgi:predicted RNase H-like HicB family nuclease